LHPSSCVKIILLSDDAVRLEPDPGPMTIEAIEPDQQYSPFHMLASSLAYCTFSVMYSWATNAKQSADDLVIDVRWSFADDPHRVSDLHLTYRWPSLPNRKREAARRVAEMCTVHETLLQPPTITIEPTPHDLAAMAASDEADAGAHVPVARGGT
jgi:uncharacterized OsmC-like protein